MVPPVAASVVVYGTPTWPPGSGLVVVMARVAGAMVMVRTAVSDWAGVPESTTLNVSVLVTAAVGVPEMVPLAASSESPAGSVPVIIDQV